MKSSDLFAAMRDSTLSAHARACPGCGADDLYVTIDRYPAGRAGSPALWACAACGVYGLCVNSDTEEKVTLRGGSCGGGQQHLARRMRDAAAGRVSAKAAKKLVRTCDRLAREADRDRRQGTPPESASSFDADLRPTWEGTPGLAKTWTDVNDCLLKRPRCARVRQGGEDLDVISGADVACIQAIGLFNHAHPVYVGAAQLEALPDAPDWTSRTAAEYAAHLVGHLPFPALYLDFTSTAGDPARVPYNSHEASRKITQQRMASRVRHFNLYGALVWDATDRPSLVTAELDPYYVHEFASGITVVPFGCTLQHDVHGERGAADAHDRGLGAATPLGVATYGGEGSQAKGESASAWVWGRMSWDHLPTATADDVQIGCLHMTLQDLADARLPELEGYRGPASVMCGSPRVIRGAVLDANQTDGGYAWYRDLDDVPDRPAGTAISEAALVVASATRALAAVHLLTAANVQLVQAPVTRQVRRQAERTGRPIAQVVHVHVPRRRAARPPKTSNGPARNFTHRFDRTAYYRHVTRGSHVQCPRCQARPKEIESCGRCGGTGLDRDRVQTCTRRDEATGRLTCPHGCRREWVPATVVGDEELPYVPKTRVVHGA